MINGHGVDFERIARRFSSVKIIAYENRYMTQALEVARQIHAHSIYADIPLNNLKLIGQLTVASTGVAPDRYFRLAVRDGEVLGGFLGYLVKLFFADQLTAKDLGWWVKEGSRGSAAAVLLLHDFEKWAKLKGARKVMIGQSGVEGIEHTGKLFWHCGYRFTGYNTCKEL